MFSALGEKKNTNISDEDNTDNSNINKGKLLPKCLNS